MVFALPDTLAVSGLEGRSHLQRIINLALRAYTLIFSFGSSLGLLGIGLVAKLSGQHNLVLQNMPWKGEELTNWLLGLGIFGLLASSIGAIAKGPLRFLGPIWSLVFAFLMIKGNFFSTKSYEGLADFQQTVSLTMGSAGAVITSLLTSRKKT